MVLMNLKSTYQQAQESFIPGPEDSPSNIWFYAAWEGAKAVCQSLEIEINSINHQIHHALCASKGDWNLFQKDLIYQTNNLTYPEKPGKSYHHDYEPVFTKEDVRKKAKEIFTASFKTTFPGKRINSKFAQEKWEKIKEKAEEIATNELQTNWNNWKKREDERQTNFLEKLFKWEETCYKINQIKESIQKITKEKEKN